MEAKGEQGRRLDPVAGLWLGVLVLDLAVTCWVAGVLVTWSVQDHTDPTDPGPVMADPSDTFFVGMAALLVLSAVATAFAVLRRANQPETVRGGRAVSVLRLVLLVLVILVSLIPGI
ncbi:hypothetical protein [Streptomyces sp. NPDC093970]|uniref:hypothetical protein n=1 Tax=Streptomyces sp. NPDC093970 TaxID=3155076 RepID=UPI0034463F21